MNAQVTKSTSTQNNQAKTSSQTTQTNTQKPVTMSQATDSIKLAVNDFKKSMNSLFGIKIDTIQIFIPDIEYDDTNLSLFKESLKKIKGGKFVTMQYKASNATLEICYKGSSTELWDQIPVDSKKAFRIVEANDSNMTLAVRK
jgi:hypothetical protein